MKNNKLTILVYLILAIVLSTSVSAVENYYELSLKYDKGDIYLLSMQIKPLDYKPKTMPLGDHAAIVDDKNGKNIYAEFITFPNLLVYDNIDPETGEITGGGIKELDTAETTIYIPYYEDAAQIDIITSNEEDEIVTKLSIDVKDYSPKLSGQDIKEPSKEDSSVTTPLEDQDEKDSLPIDRDEEVNESETKGYLGLMGLAGGLLILAMIIVYEMRKRKRGRQNPQQYQQQPQQQQYQQQQYRR